MIKFIKGTHVPEENKTYLLFNGNKRLGFKHDKIAVINEDVFVKFDGIALLLDVWEQINDGVVETVECLSQGTDFSLVPKGLLQYTFSVEDARQHGRKEWHPWCKDYRWVVPRSVLCVIKPIDVGEEAKSA